MKKEETSHKSKDLHLVLSRAVPYQPPLLISCSKCGKPQPAIIIQLKKQKLHFKNCSAKKCREFFLLISTLQYLLMGIQKVVFCVQQNSPTSPYELLGEI